MNLQEIFIREGAALFTIYYLVPIPPPTLLLRKIKIGKGCFFLSHFNANLSLLMLNKIPPPLLFFFVKNKGGQFQVSASNIRESTKVVSIINLSKKNIFLRLQYFFIYCFMILSSALKILLTHSYLFVRILNSHQQRNWYLVNVGHNLRLSYQFRKKNYNFLSEGFL